MEDDIHPGPGRPSVIPPSDQELRENFISMRQAWIDSQNEADRSIFYVASASAGYCCSQFMDEKYGFLPSTFLFFSLISFAATALMAIGVFRGNARLLKRLLKDPSDTNREPALAGLDTRIPQALVLGGSFFLIAALLYRVGL